LFIILENISFISLEIRALLKTNNFSCVLQFLKYTEAIASVSFSLQNTEKRVCFHFCRECAFLCTTNRMRTLITWRVRSGAHPCVTGATALLRSFPSFLRHPYRVSRSSRTTIDNATQGPLLAPARTPHVRTLLNLSPCYSHNAMS